ncbi:Uncharacterized protein SCF082_LOCUS27478, partial [Durusdinium trenchii]
SAHVCGITTNLAVQGYAAMNVACEENQIFTLCCFFGLLFLVMLEDTPGLLAAAAEERRQMCADARACMEAVRLQATEGTSRRGTGHKAQVYPRCCRKGRRGVLRRRGAVLRSFRQIKVLSVSRFRHAQVQTKVFPQSVLASSEPRIPCPFTDPAIRRGSAMLWAHMRRMHPHLGLQVCSKSPTKCCMELDHACPL